MNSFNLLLKYLTEKSFRDEGSYWITWKLSATGLSPSATSYSYHDNTVSKDKD